MRDASGTTRYLAIGAGKDSNIYIVDRTDLGKFHPTMNQIYQEIDGALTGGMWAMPARYSTSVFFGPQGNNLLQFEFLQAELSASPVSRSAASFP